MKLLLILSLLLFIFSGFYIYKNRASITGAPPYGEDENSVPDNSLPYVNWQRPEGPAKVGIQVGHWKSNEVPDELHRLRNNTGSSGSGKSEWEVNYEIADKLKTLLETNGIIVDILPATIPPKYWADVFIAVHADGNEDSSVNGFKFAHSWRDYTGKADNLVSLLNNAYEKETKLILDSNISRNMKGYYAFSWWRYEHSVHPMAVSVIAETGFLTNPNDRKIIVNKPELAAAGLYDGIIQFLKQEKLL